MNANHREVCRFHDANDGVYRDVLYAVVGLVEKARQSSNATGTYLIVICIG